MKAKFNISPVLTTDGWAMNLRDSKKKKGIRERMERLESNNQVLAGEIKLVEENIRLLTTLTSKDYKLIDPCYGVVVDNKDYYDDVARKLLKSKGYEYVKSFETLGELWVKEEGENK